MQVDWNLEKTIFVALKIEKPEFTFMLSMQDGNLVFQRNGNISIHEAKEHNGKVVWIGFIWHPNGIKTFFRPSKDPKSIVSYEIQTAFTLPPPEILHYARETNRIPTKTYSSVAEFSNQVIKAIQLAQIEINQTGVFTNFWDIAKKGGKISQRIPKDEINIHNSIHSLVFNYCLKNGINIEREKCTAIGDIDFVFSSVVNGKYVEIPCEVKKANSNDVIQGYEKQLPAYLDQIGAEIGIYLIVGFAGDWVKGDTLDDVYMKLYYATKRAQIENIRILTLDVSKPVSASKIK